MIKNTHQTRTPLEERYARRSDLYLTTHITHNRGTSMHPAGFEPAIPASERPQTHPLDLPATGIGKSSDLLSRNIFTAKGFHDKT